MPNHTHIFIFNLASSLNLRSMFPAILFYFRTLSFTHADDSNGEDAGGDDDMPVMVITMVKGMW